MKISLKGFVTLIIAIMLILGLVATIIKANIKKENNNDTTESVVTQTSNSKDKEEKIENKFFKEYEGLNQNQIVEKLDNLTNEEFANIAYSPDAILVKDLTKEDNLNTVMGIEEFWFVTPLRIGTASSKEECEKLLNDFAKENGDTIINKYIGENDYYYEYSSERKGNNTTFRSRYIIFKDSIITIKESTNPEDDKYIIDNATFIKKDENTIKTVLDLSFVSLSKNDVLYRYVESNSSDITYVLYKTEVTYGEPGVDDNGKLIKTTYTVDKETGNVSVENETLKDITFEGTAE